VLVAGAGFEPAAFRL